MAPWDPVEPIVSGDTGTGADLFLWYVSLFIFTGEPGYFIGVLGTSLAPTCATLDFLLLSPLYRLISTFLSCLVRHTYWQPDLQPEKHIFHL